MHDLIGVLIESIAVGLGGETGQNRGWRYVIGYFALLGIVVALVLAFVFFK